MLQSVHQMTQKLRRGKQKRNSFLLILQNRRPSVYLPTREYPSEQSEYQSGRIVPVFICTQQRNVITVYVKYVVVVVVLVDH